MSFAARRIINAALTYCSVARLNCEICDWLQLFNCTAHRSAQPTRDWFPSFPSRSSSPVPATLSLSTGHTLYSQSEWCFCHLTPSRLGCLCMVQIALCLPSRLSTLFLCVLAIHLAASAVPPFSRNAYGCHCPCPASYIF